MNLYKLTLLFLLLLTQGCAIRKALHVTTDSEVLDKLGYTGEHRAVYRIGEQKCFTGDDRQPFPQKDLRCY